MRRTSSLLAATALAASALLVPSAAAYADVSDAKLTVGFDRLAKDRVAKISLSAKSASGVTNVTAHVRYKSSTAEPYATFELKRTQGTDNDGVWEAEYRPDIAVRPGGSVVDTVITTADGATTIRRAGLIDCYTTSIEGLTAEPAAVDAEHPDAVLRGRLMVQKSRDEAAEPAAGAELSAGTADATTAADGSFELNVRGGATVTAYAQGPLCYVSQNSPVTVNKQATEITARMTPGMTVAPGTDVSVDGKVVRHGSSGLAPAAGVEVRVNVPTGMADIGPLWVETAADGTFHTYFKAGGQVGLSGQVTAEAVGGEFLTGGKTSLGTLNIRNTAQISGFVVRGRVPLGYGDTMVADGTLSIRPNLTDVTNLPMYLEYSPDGKTGWTVWAQQWLPRPKTFAFNTTKPVTKDGYWRLRYPGGPLNMPAVSQVKYVDVKYRTQMYNFNASPEPVKKGKAITVKGLLYRFMDKAVPGPNAPVSIYFKPSGSSTWTRMAVVKTASNGWFSKNFKAVKDGTWMAAYEGSANYLASEKPSDYVDVR